MSTDEQLLAYLDLCETVLARQKRDGIWPWPDSPNSADMIESKGNANDA